MHGLHFQAGAWDFMAHGSATLSYTDQGGKRGDKDLFSTNMFMMMGSRKFGESTVGIRACSRSNRRRWRTTGIRCCFNGRDERRLDSARRPAASA